MHAYRLENKRQDGEFLSGAPVSCRAVINSRREQVAAGDNILVELSNGKKYKGRVVEFRSFLVNEVEAGDLVIIRA